MPIYKGSNEIDEIYMGGAVDSVYKGNQLVFRKGLPAGTVLFEKFGNAGGGGYTTYELVLPTDQEIEIICVGGGSPVVGTVIDL